MNLPAGTTCLYDPAMDTYTFVFANGSQVKFTGVELQQMTHPGLMSYTGLGGLHGGYRTPTQTTHGSSSNGTNPGNPGAQAAPAHYQAFQNSIAAQQAALANTYAGGIGGFGYPVPTQDQIVKYAGIKAGEIIAYRCWLIKGNPINGYTLTSCFVETVWLANKPMTGNVGSHNYCGLGYGVHSFKTKKLALEYGRGYSANYCALGRVKLWGEVIEHEKGYRAENAKIISIDQVLNPKDDQRILRQLRKRYGVNEYANGNDTGSRQVGPGDGEEEGEDQGIGRDDLPSGSRDSRKGGCWNYLRGFIQGRGV